jgi:hypothetical protein
MEEEPPSKFAGTKLAQQALPSLRPIIRARHAYVIFTFFAIFFFAIGIAQTLTVARLHDVRMRYDDTCGTSANCTIQFTIPLRLTGRITFYYRLTNFYQNHRRYASSRSAEQLAGDYVVYDDLDVCDPITNFSESLVRAPCGLAAATVFNDTFEFDGPINVSLTETGIAWKSDLKSLYKPSNGKYPPESRWLDNDTRFPGGQTNEHFVVWMRIGALPDLLKPYSHCEDCVIEAETYTVQIENSYPASLFNGEKWIGIREESDFGPQNSFLEVLCYVYGAVWLLCDLVIVAVTLIRPRLPGDPELIRKLRGQAGVAQRPEHQ